MVLNKLVVMILLLHAILETCILYIFSPVWIALVFTSKYS